MNAEQIALVQSTFAKVEPIAQQAGEFLYDRLFGMDPSLRSLFRGDLKNQSRMVIKAIGLAVKGLDQPASTAAELQALGSRHVGYGVIPADFEKFAAAMLWSLEQAIGPSFTPEARDAWIEAFEVIKQQMKASVR